MKNIDGTDSAGKLAGANEVAELMELFGGCDSRHGTHGEPVWEPDKGKWTIRSTARTLREGPTADLWQQHLDGKRPLGVIPITSEGLCWWGSIDVDVYDIDTVGTVRKVRDLKLPLVPCTSKSGGLHLFMFLSQPTPAAEVQAALRSIAGRLELSPHVEVFPKQLSISEEKAGSWIVMPYFGGTFGGKLREQVGLNDYGNPMPLEGFIRAAREARLTPADFVSTGASARAVVTPPRQRAACGEAADLTGRGFGGRMLAVWSRRLAGTPEGRRNDMIAAAAFHLGRIVGRDWVSRDEAEDALRTVFSQWPNVDHSEDTMRRQLDRGAANPHDDLAPEAPPWPDLRTRRKDGSSPGEIRVVQLSDVPMRAMDWLWKGHLLRGSIEMLSGGVNLGKSQVQMGWIASVTAGRPWPDGTPGPEPGNVILITAEDNLYHTVGPRCRAAKGDPARVTVVEGIRRDERTDMFTLTTDLGELERLIREKNAALVAIDPITAYMGGKVDSHNATDVRSVLSPLKDIAERTNAAFSIITHPPKSASGKRANDLFIGSQAFVAVARIGHLILEEREKDEDGKWVETGRCLLTIAKNNLHRYPPTLAYTIDEVAVGQDDHGEVITAPYVVWDPKPVDGTADQLMKLYDGRGEERNPAVALLRDLLGSPDDCRSVDAASVTRAREARGLSEDQMKRARAKLGVRATKVGQPGTAGQKWVWHYDGCDPKSGELLV